VTAALGYVHAGVAEAACWDLQVHEGLASSRTAVQIAEHVHDDALWARAAYIHGLHLASSGRLREGRHLLERAWQTANRLNHPVSFFISFLGSALANWFVDPREAQWWCERELAQQRVAHASGQRQRLLARLAATYALGGDLERASSIAAGVPASYNAWPFFYWSGEWDRCEAIARDWITTSKRSGERAFAFEATYDLAHLIRSRGDAAKAGAELESVLNIAADGGERTYEVAALALLALVCAEMRELQQAELHLARCRQIMDNGEDWRGLAGRVLLAEGVTAMGGGDIGAGIAHFRNAINVFRQHQFPWGEAEVFFVWGRALHHVGEAPAAIARFESALEIYSRHGAGERWLDRVRSERVRVVT